MSIAVIILIKALIGLKCENMVMGISGDTQLSAHINFAIRASLKKPAKNKSGS